MIASDEHGTKSVRQIANEILAKVDTRKAYADILLDQALRMSALNERDRALLTELTYGTLRWRGSLDARLIRSLRRPLAEVDPRLRNLLRLTCYQLLYLDRVPDYAAVNEAVEIAKLYGGRKAGGFVNGVLRNFLREKHAPVPVAPDATAASLAVEYSHPEWLVQRWLEEFGAAEAALLMCANNEKPPLVLRANLLKCKREELVDRLSRSGVEARASSYSPQGVFLPAGGAVENLPGFSEGSFQVQGEASQLVAYLLSPHAGERILDACAAPGGKSAHIAELMHDAGEIMSVDSSARGIEKIRQNGTRLGLKSVHALHADITEEDRRWGGAPFDRVLVDAPCSGLGTLRAHPEIKWQRNEDDVRRLSGLQLRILNRVAGYLKRGGILVYSTCTLSWDENERNTENFCASHPEFELQHAARYLPDKAKHMVRGKYFQALPHRDNTDGFFASRMRRLS